MQLSDIPRNPDRTTLRNFGLLCLLFFGGVALWRIRTDGPTVSTWISLGAGSLAALTGLVQPSLLRWVFVGWMYLVFPIGWVVSHVALGVLFAVAFVPLGLLFRVLSRDRLHRRKQASVSTYWAPKEYNPDPAAYFRQF